MIEFQNNKPVANNGLTFISSIKSTYKNLDRPISFFEEVLGFDTNKLFINIEFKNVNIEGSLTFTPYITNYNEMDNFSSATISTDTYVDKTGANSFIKLDMTNGSKVLTNDINYIYAEKKLNNITANPYYVVEVENFNNTLNSVEYYSHKIAGIVGRYYSVNNYTQGDISTSIPYINNSNKPIIFNSLRVKISNGENENDIDIGDDNTIFLIIQRGKYQQQFNKKMIEEQNQDSKLIKKMLVKKNPFI